VGVPAVTVTGFQPSTAYQGDPDLVLTFTGTGFPAASVIEVLPPGASTYTAIPSATSGCSGSPSTCTTVRAPKSLIQSPGVPVPEGQLMARVRPQPTDPPTSEWPLRVLSNQAILRDYAAVPDPAQAGTVGGAKTSLSFQVANIHGVGSDFSGVRVLFMDPTGAVTVKTLTPNLPNAATTTLTVTSPNPALPLAGLDVGTYLFKIWNPNSTPSNPLPFAVTAGYPSVSSACLVPVPPTGCVVPLDGNGCCRGASAGSATSLTIQLNGTNFAKPDASGNGSKAMIAAYFSPNYPAPDPCNVITTAGTQFQAVDGTPKLGTVTVNSPTTITVQLDPRTAIIDPGGTTYYVGVWNPGINNVQKSDCGVPLNATGPDGLPKLPWFKLLP
jgi:hypothetical protein